MSTLDPLGFAFLIWQAVMASPIAIEVPDASADELQSLEHGCHRALGAGHCEVTDHPVDAERPYRVRVTWDVAHREARLEFFEPGNATASGIPAATRVLSFTEADPVEARFEAVGLVVAAYVMGRSTGRENPPQNTPPPPPDDEAERLPLPRWALALRLGAGQGLEHGHPRYLLGIGTAVRPAKAPVYLLAEVDGTHTFGELASTSWSGALGASVWIHTPWPQLNLQLALSMAAERFQVSADHPATEQGESGHHARLGGRVDFEVLACPWQRGCFFGGVRLNAMYPAIRVELLGAPAGRQDAISLDGLLGIRISG